MYGLRNTLGAVSNLENLEVYRKTVPDSYSSLSPTTVVQNIFSA